MLHIGNYNTLKVIKLVDFGAYLDGGEGTEILLPKRYVPDGLEPGDDINVFIYHDNEGRLIATTLRPYATVGEFCFLTVKSVSSIGAFLDWGLMKDLLVPFREQKSHMMEGRRYLVYVRLDHASGRIMASERVEKFLGNIPPRYRMNQEVDALVTEETEIGYRAIVDNAHWGMFYHNEVFRHLPRGKRLKAYVKGVRDDGKIDLSATPLGYRKIDGIAGTIVRSLEMNRGFLPVHDKSDPDEIYALFQCSKKTFKQAIGTLYRQHVITLEADGIRLTAEE